MHAHRESRACRDATAEGGPPHNPVFQFLGEGNIPHTEPQRGQGYQHVRESCQAGMGTAPAPHVPDQRPQRRTARTQQ